VKVIGLTRATTMVVSVVVAAVVLTSCSPATLTPSASRPSGSSSHSGPSGGGSRQHGGTATWAEAPGARPDYIFPFVNLAYFTVANVKQFQYLMYRPLYWFGTQGQPTLDPSLSLAAPPVYSDGETTVVVKLKPYK
jgi:peptide/nickel transport system substrate-binding protein